MKKIFCAVIIIVMVVILGYTQVKAEGNTYEVNTPEDFINALVDIHNNSNGDFVIDIKNDITINTTTTPIDNGNTVTVRGNGHTICFMNGYNDKFNVNNATLNLGLSDGSDTLKLKGQGPDGSTSESLVMVSNGTLNMYKGVSMSDNYGGGAALTGAAVRVGTDGTFNMYGGSINNNSCDSASVGAAITLDSVGGVFNMYDGEIKDNYSKGYGGAVYLSNNNVANIKGGSICNNSGAYGGAIYNGGRAIVENVTISNNEAKHDIISVFGGAIYCDNGSTLKMTNCTLENNKGQYGGAISNSGDCDIKNCTFKENTGYLGGVIYNISECNIENCIFDGNSSSAFAGVILNNSKCDIKNCTFDGNSASSYGGAIMNYSGTITMENSIIKNNSATYGGGIFNYSATSEIESTNDEIFSNTGSSGAGVFLNNGTADFSTTKVYNNKASGDSNDYYISRNASAQIIDAKNINKAVTFDGKICNINGWYKDVSSNRFSLDNRTDEVAYDSIATGTSYALTAAGDVAALITFNTDGGSDVEEQVIVLGEKATKPANPTRRGYSFGGWYTDNTYSIEFDFLAPITSNTTIYAKWIPETTDDDTEPTEEDNQTNTEEKEEEPANNVIESTDETTEENTSIEKSIINTAKTGDRGIVMYIVMITVSLFVIYQVKKVEKKGKRRK